MTPEEQTVLEAKVAELKAQRDTEMLRKHKEQSRNPRPGGWYRPGMPACW